MRVRNVLTQSTENATLWFPLVMRDYEGAVFGRRHAAETLARLPPWTNSSPGLHRFRIAVGLSKFVKHKAPIGGKITLKTICLDQYALAQSLLHDDDAVSVGWTVGCFHHLAAVSNIF